MTVLRLASSWFSSKLANMAANTLNSSAQSGGRAQRQPAPPAAAAPAACGSGGAAGGHVADLPVIRVPLGGPEEVPSARAAIRFAYTGEVAAGSGVREVLELYRQGQYLQLEGCAAACLAAIESMLAAARTSGCSGSGGCPAALELYGNIRLWPDPALEPAFAAIVSTARARLVSHFGGALRTLNTPELRRQLLTLPAECLEALLESDDFGTDVEDSVLLMLAAWVEANGGGGAADAEAVERLCRLVRLAQLSPDFAGAVLPMLACARSMRVSCRKRTGSGGLGWFPITCADAVLLASCCAAAGSSQKKYERLRVHAAKAYDLQATWFSTKPRRQCPTMAAPGPPGRPQQYSSFGWSIGQDKLLRKLRDLLPGSTIRLFGSLDNGLDAMSAHGLEWQPFITLTHGAVATGPSLYCGLPAAYGLEAFTTGDRLMALAQVGARLEVDRWRGDGVREVAFAQTLDASELFGVGTGMGFPYAMPLKHGGEGTAEGGGGSLLRSWSAYLHKGKITGRLVLLPLSASR
ncbi:hypothetical protein GPECTOR_26g584 [Gonium pectorale]|uniref:BACK domain-containing protein n=1 Tax=Gonium pectorale TaxID=33097 RepID=A0A150GFR2_GONPE|nr:hypothetical protein GPECTOR_26g584 [Gonium pectorale]|eukprot:KXZ48681.1 hypothetical protein GPECTOR_26g584 [Gonium pectorale]